MPPKSRSVIVQKVLRRPAAKVRPVNGFDEMITEAEANEQPPPASRSAEIARRVSSEVTIARDSLGRGTAASVFGEKEVKDAKDIIQAAIDTWWNIVSKKLDMKPTPFSAKVMGHGSYLNKALKGEGASPNLVNLIIMNRKTLEYAAKQRIAVPSFWDIFQAKAAGKILDDLSEVVTPLNVILKSGSTIDVPGIEGGVSAVDSKWLMDSFPSSASRLVALHLDGFIYLIDPETPEGGSDSHRLIRTEEGYSVVADWTWIAREGRAEITPADPEAPAIYTRRPPEDLGRVVAKLGEATTVQLTCIDYTP